MIGVGSGGVIGVIEKEFYRGKRLNHGEVSPLKRS